MKVKAYHLVQRKGNNLAKKSRVMSYATIVSGTVFDKEGIREYTVVRYKDRKMSCNCPSKLFRRVKRCKHLQYFIDWEKKYRASRKGFKCL